MRTTLLLLATLFGVTQEMFPQKQNVEQFTVNGVPFNMIRVEGGTFLMGATREQGDDAQDEEKPAHEVTLSTYYIGETEVTMALWNAIMEPVNSRYNDAEHPVHKISWIDCQKFIRKLNAMTGKHFRLPTEAEWEFAARGGNKSKGYKYSGGNNSKSVGWTKENNKEYGIKHVKQKKANELGLYDMSGNVWEWCQDWYIGRYVNRAQTNPTGPPRGEQRVLRGGCWGAVEKCSRVSYRFENEPNERMSIAGMRLCMTDNEDQQLKIEQMSAAGNDISASQFRVMDAKGKPCALVKVLLPAEGATFEGNVTGIPEFKQGEYWVYMPDGTKQTIVKVPGVKPCTVDFSKYSITQVKSLTTYTLTLIMPQKSNADIGLNGQLNILYGPTGAEVLLDGKKLGKSPNVFDNIAAGTHQVEIRMEGYNTQQVPVNIEIADETKLTGELIAATKSKTNAAVETITVKGVAFKMIRVEGGTFTMGNTKDKELPQWQEKERPHTVALSTYYIGETEVTQKLWKAVMGENPALEKGDNVPANGISYGDCLKFIEKLNALTGKTFRLPTEAEWEYAARGGNKSKGYTFAGSNFVNDVAWYASNSGDKPISGGDIREVNRNNCRPHNVKQKKANELGLYDMSGNVKEWCYDGPSNFTDAFMMNPVGSMEDSSRVLRGGGGRSSNNGCKTFTRDSWMSEMKSNDIGMRLAF